MVVHADNAIDFQEFRIMPIGGVSCAESVLMGADKGALKKQGLNTNVGDEGGFAPNLKSAEAALDIIMRAIEAPGYKPGANVVIALDCASTEMFKEGAYHYHGDASIEHGMAEDDWKGWKSLIDALGGKCRL